MRSLMRWYKWLNIDGSMDGSIQELDKYVYYRVRSMLLKLFPDSKLPKKEILRLKTTCSISRRFIDWTDFYHQALEFC